MIWTTVVEVARVLEDESTIAEAELMAATDAAKAAVFLIRGGSIEFDFDGRFVEKERRREDRRHRFEEKLIDTVHCMNKGEVFLKGEEEVRRQKTTERRKRGARNDTSSHKQLCAWCS